MKSFFYISVLLFTVTISAQKAVVKEIGYNHQYLEILLQDIDLLEIVHTDEQKISIFMKDYPENPTQLEIKNSDDLIKIAAINISALQEDSKKDKFCYEQPLFPSYKLTIPKGCKISIAYINGNLNSDNFNGNLNLRLNTGDVTIKNFKGSINAELFSGNFNATIYNTEIDVVSSKGRITTTFPRSDWQKTDISLKGTLGIKKNLLLIV